MIDVSGERIFVVGDIHGCAALLEALLKAFVAHDEVSPRTRRLVFLGDVINRGPDTIGALKRWATDEPMRGVTKVDRLMGNHEQLLLLAMGGGPDSDLAHDALMRNGGDRFLAELRVAVGSPDAAFTKKLLRTVLGRSVCQRLQHGLKSHASVGNLLFVHAGLHPDRQPAEFLALSATRLPKNNRHWAWIDSEFLASKQDFKGTIVVHGHTPPATHRSLTGRTDPHSSYNCRLCLDGGSARTGIVAGAQIEDGRYRIFRAIASG